MNDIITTDIKDNIINGLLSGLTPEILSKRLKCPLYDVLRIMGSEEFRELCKEHLKNFIVYNGLAAVKKIKDIAENDTISKATQLKANQWLVENALNINELGFISETPATMTQDQLARRLKELQTEAVKRAKPIDTGVIDQAPEHKSADDVLFKML